jgi:hypothetical protein
LGNPNINLKHDRSSNDDDEACEIDSEYSNSRHGDEEDDECDDHDDHDDSRGVK